MFRGPTFVVEEVKSFGDVPDHTAGLQLIKVLTVLDVSQNGACMGKEESFQEQREESFQEQRAFRETPNSFM